MEEVKKNLQDEKSKKSCLESECLEYMGKIYEISETQHDMSTKCTISSENNELSQTLANRRCLLEQEIIGNYQIATNLASINNPVSADRIYKLSVTDLFVEKAIELLNEEARKHEKNGNDSFKWTSYLIFFGAVVAFFQMIGAVEYCQKKIFYYPDVNQTREIQLLIQQSTQSDITFKQVNKTVKEKHNISKINESIVETLVDAKVSMAWKDALMTFTKSFTFYGLLVLAAVFLKRQGKASLDQAERIKDKRHALREGRLYIHLKNGQIQTIAELEQAFNWNSSQQNAFSEINTEAQAPWGTVFKGITETFTKTVESIMKNKNSGEQK